MEGDALFTRNACSRTQVLWQFWFGLRLPTIFSFQLSTFAVLVAGLDPRGKNVLWGSELVRLGESERSLKQPQ